MDFYFNWVEECSQTMLFSGSGRKEQKPKD